MDLSIRDAILLLRKNGYTVTPPEKEEVTDEYSFEKAWDLYQKKVGPKEKLRAKWNKLPLKDRKAAMVHIPLYVQSTPDKTYRKHFQTYLNQRGWEDEIIMHNDRQLTKQQAMRDIAKQAAADNSNLSKPVDREVFNPFATDAGV